MKILGLVLLSMTLSVGIGMAKPPKTLSKAPSACDPGKSHIVLVNKSTSVVWAAGTMVSWKTSHGEVGKMKLSSAVLPGKSLKVGITKPSPKACKAKIRLP
jgi:hypothetical protein